MQGFQMVMNFLMMPMFFLSGALFPLVGLPIWMTVLTRLDPASYGIDPIRRALLGAPAERLALTIGDQTVPILAEVGIVLAFGLVMLGIAARSFQHRD
jgi:ABC-2 type transport system permease protein